MSDTTVTAEIQAIIDFLQEVLDDADKFDRGFDAPGVRIRKAAQQARNDLGLLRQTVQDIRSNRKD